MSKLHSFFLLIIVIGILSWLGGCAAPPKPPLTGLVPGREVDTLNAAISLSVRTPDKKFGGRGYLVYKRPDRFHLAILSPFGTTLADIYSNGDRFTCVIPSRQTAYSGLISDLPDRDGLKAWSMMRWVVETPPPPGPALKREYVNASGVKELLYYDDRGLLVRKETEEGDRVVYRDYRNVDGVAFPDAIELTDSRENTVRVVFEDPEINRSLEDAVLNPRLEGVRVLPFGEFKGF